MKRNFAHTRVLVTGASGFIGSNLCQRLINEGARVHAVGRTGRGEWTPGVERQEADLTDCESTRRVFAAAKPDLVFHVAGHSHGMPQLDQVQPALASNLVATVNLLTVAAEIGCERVILTGSHDEPDPNEASADAFVPASPYAASKLAANLYARMFHALFQVPVSVARIYMAYGAGQRNLNKLIPYVILSVLRGQAPRLSSGTRPMDWIYIDDVISGLLAVAESGTLDGQTVGLGTGVVHTSRQAAERLVALMNSGITLEFGAVPDRQHERARYCDLADTRAKIDWNPVVSFDEGLQRSISWYRDHVAPHVISPEHRVIAPAHA
ncbi:MAG: NAD-dependent epimerase/dehydratase family protein [Burkholderiaceae bacterium]